MESAYGKESILYMIEEVGEVIAVLKKKGDRAIVENQDVRNAFLEEMADVLMYYTDALLRFQVTPEEISKAYIEKHKRNIGRDYSREYKEKYHG
jgi:NTP pyrophosphatase (non-canonical NTP hydrolase)